MSFCMDRTNTEGHRLLLDALGDGSKTELAARVGLSPNDIVLLTNGRGASMRVAAALQRGLGIPMIRWTEPAKGA